MYAVVVKIEIQQNYVCQFLRIWNCAILIYGKSGPAVENEHLKH